MFIIRTNFGIAGVRLDIATARKLIQELGRRGIKAWLSF